MKYRSQSSQRRNTGRACSEKAPPPACCQHEALATPCTNDEVKGNKISQSLYTFIAGGKKYFTLSRLFFLVLYIPFLEFFNVALELARKTLEVCWEAEAEKNRKSFPRLELFAPCVIA